MKSIKKYTACEYHPILFSHGALLNRINESKTPRANRIETIDTRYLQFDVTG